MSLSARSGGVCREVQIPMDIVAEMDSQSNNFYRRLPHPGKFDYRLGLHLSFLLPPGNRNKSTNSLAHGFR